MRFSRDNWIVLGVLAAVTASYLLVVYRWQSAALSEVRSQRSRRKRQLAADGVTASRVPSLIREINALSNRYGKNWDRRLPKRKELAGFLREISANLADENLPNQIIAPGSPTRGPLYNVLPITMKFEGNFLLLAGFLKRVDGMARLTRIEKLIIDGRKDRDGLGIEVGMNIYFTEQ